MDTHVELLDRRWAYWMCSLTYSSAGLHRARFYEYCVVAKAWIEKVRL